MFKDTTSFALPLSFADFKPDRKTVLDGLKQARTAENTLSRKGLKDKAAEKNAEARYCGGRSPR